MDICSCEADSVPIDLFKFKVGTYESVFLWRVDCRLMGKLLELRLLLTSSVDFCIDIAIYLPSQAILLISFSPYPVSVS